MYTIHMWGILLCIAETTKALPVSSSFTVEKEVRSSPELPLYPGVGSFVSAAGK